MKSFFLSAVLLMGFLGGSAPESYYTPELAHLLKVTGVPHDGTLKSIVEETQKKWLRPPQKERWEVQDTLSEVQRKAVMDYCSKTGFFQEIKPSYKSYDYVFVMGASISRMEKRLAYLTKMAEAGIHFNQVILLTSDRPLDPSVESIPVGCKTEGEALTYLWKAHPLFNKTAWKQFDHPMIKGPDGTMRRPSAVDGYKLWLTTSPRKGSGFIISNQPFCLYFQAAAKTVFPKGFMVETGGPGADPASQNGAVLLDTIARYLYESSKKLF